MGVDEENLRVKDVDVILENLLFQYQGRIGPSELYLRAYYGNVRTHTLLDEREHDPERRKGVCCWGKLPNHGRFRRGAIRRYALGCRWGVLRTIRCIPVATVPPNCRPRTAPSNAGRGSRTPGPRGSYCSIPSRRCYLLKTIEVRLHGRGVVSVFSGSFVALEAGVDCTDSRVHGKHRAVVC